MAYPRAVEALRPIVEKYFPPNLVDKAMHVINIETGGRGAATASGDGGYSHGPFQVQDNRRFANRPTAEQLKNPEFNIRYAATQLGAAQGNWKAWGENNLYEGKPFGALGNVPYTGSTGAPQVTGRPPTGPGRTPNMRKSKEELAQEKFGKPYDQLGFRDQIRVDDAFDAQGPLAQASTSRAELEGLKATFSGAKATVKNPDGTTDTYERKPDGNYDLTGSQAPAEPKPPQGAVTLAELRQLGATGSGPKLSIKNPDGTTDNFERKPDGNYDLTTTDKPPAGSQSATQTAFERNLARLRGEVSTPAPAVAPGAPQVAPQPALAPTGTAYASDQITTPGGASIPRAALDLKENEAYGRGGHQAASNFLNPTTLGFDPVTILRAYGEGDVSGQITPRTADRASQILEMQRVFQQKNPNVQMTAADLRGAEGRPQLSQSDLFKNAMREGVAASGILRKNMGEGVGTMPQGTSYYDPSRNPELYAGVLKPPVEQQGPSSAWMKNYMDAIALMEGNGMEEFAEGGQIFAGTPAMPNDNTYNSHPGLDWMSTMQGTSPHIFQHQGQWYVGEFPNATMGPYGNPGDAAGAAKGQMYGGGGSSTGDMKARRQGLGAHAAAVGKDGFSIAPTLLSSLKSGGGIGFAGGGQFNTSGEPVYMSTSPGGDPFAVAGEPGAGNETITVTPDPARQNLQAMQGMVGMLLASAKGRQKRPYAAMSMSGAQPYGAA